MPTWTRQRWIVVIASVILGVAIAVVIGALLFNPVITRYVESPSFRGKLEFETAKGLHFPKATFAPIKRSGPLTAESESFSARDGRKAMTTLDAQRVTGRFNPLGVFLRRWQIDDLHIDRARIGIHVYEPKP